MNLLSNATGLDGVTGWTSPGGAVTVDSSVVGAPNRIAFVGSGASLYAEADVSGLTSIFARLDHRRGHIASVAFYNGGGAVGAPIALPVRRVGRGDPSRGVAGTFSASWGAVALPGGATVARLVSAPLGAAPGAPVAFRPMIAAGEQCWRPGEHLNPDLELPSWPASLPNPDPSSLELEPISIRKGFEGDAGVPITRRVSSVSRRFASFDLVLDALERDALDQFWRDNHPEFWFIRPDNGDLCVAEWAADGDPSDSGSVASGRRTRVKLLLRDS